MINPQAINARLDVVKPSKEHRLYELTYDLALNLCLIERLNTRASLGKAGPKELAQIRDSLNLLPDLKALIGDHPALQGIQVRLQLFRTC